MRILLCLLFVVLLLGAVVFDRERMLFCDAPHMILEILNKGGLQIQEHRYGSFITQAFPLLAAKAGLPLWGVVLLYSISFNLFYLAVAALLLFGFRNVPLAVLMALYYTLFVSDTYFWTNNEVHTSVAWTFLLMGVAWGYKGGLGRFYYLHVPVFIVLSFLSLFTHPLALLFVPFLWLFLLLSEHRPYNRKQSLLLSGLLLAMAIAKYYTMQHGWYDTPKVDRVAKASLKEVLSVFSSPMAKIMSYKFLFSYFFVPLLFVWGLYQGIKTKRHKHVALTLVFAFAYFAAVCLTYHDFIPFYTESEWMPFTLIATALFVYYGLPRLSKKTAIVVLAMIFTIRLGYIAQSSQKFRDRNEWVHAVLDRMEKQDIYKGYLYSDPTTDSLLLMSWGVPAESLLASALRGERPNRTFVIDTRENLEGRMVHDKDSMIACFKSWHYSFLDPKYFAIDTTGLYRPIR